jgi:hypothetical protein
MRLSFLLATSAAIFLLPFLAYTAGVPADDELSQAYVQTVQGARDRITSFDAASNARYESIEISRTIHAATGEVVVWVRQHV